MTGPGDAAHRPVRASSARPAAGEPSRDYRLLAENASDIVLSSSLDGVYDWVSESVTAVLGWRREDVIGGSIEDFLHPDDLRALQATARAAALDTRVSGESRFRLADGSYRWFAWTMRRTADERGRPLGYAGSMADIEDRKQMEARLAHAATHDPLTGLANRDVLLRQTQAALAAGRRSGLATALLLLDLDHFKYVNDSLGHLVGDALLCAAARRISRSVPPDALVARHGGDEIVILLPALADPAEAVRLAERLVAESRLPVVTAGVEAFATLSVGISWAEPGSSARTSAPAGSPAGSPDGSPAGSSAVAETQAIDLIREADLAMYAAKQGGRDRVVRFNASLRRAVDDRARVEHELRHALGRDELVVWYQPEVDLGDGSVRAAEALLRWRRPDGRVRPAAEFIGIAEDTGMILDIGDRVLRRACADAARWRQDGLPRPLVVRINLSALQLAEPGLLDVLDAAIADSGIDPASVCLEITETVMLHDSSTVRANLGSIRDRGIDIAIDDFGTGYGSLTYLRSFPVHVLKIDRTFVAALTTDDYGHRLVSGILALADRLGVSVTAEGVESVEQAAALRALGCTRAQGFLYSPAVPWDALCALVRAREPV